MLGRPGEQHEQQQRTGQEHVDVGHHPHTLLDSGHRHRYRRAHHQGDQRHLHPLGMRNAKQVVQARVQVQYTKAHVRAQTKDRGNNAKAVHGIADGPVDTLADQRVER
ncbi:hypothetical protein D3C80_377290 [compost metagenome]